MTKDQVAINYKQLRIRNGYLSSKRPFMLWWGGNNTHNIWGDTI